MQATGKQRSSGGIPQPPQPQAPIGARNKATGLDESGVWVGTANKGALTIDLLEQAFKRLALPVGQLEQQLRRAQAMQLASALD